jgi:hypothetical protein
MKKIQILFAAMLAVCMTSCFKTEAQVDVEVLKDGKPQSGVIVYKFTDEMGESTTSYKENAKAQATTNAGGVAHFDLKSPEDFTPSKVGNVEVKETNTFYFATFDSNNTRNGFVIVKIATGEKKTVQLEMTDVSID